MSAIILIFAIIIFLLAYKFYGSFVERRLGVDQSIETPSHTMSDGVDYCPAKRSILFGHHFSSIAGAAPIVGPIVAAAYGWLPAFIWIIAGGIFLGAVHDFSSLIASVRNKGRSIGEVLGMNVNKGAKKLFLIFLWFTLILVISVFIDISSKTFVAEPGAGTSSILFIPLAILFGLMIYRLKTPVGITSIIGVALLFACMVLGWHFPIVLESSSWNWILLSYIFIASVIPAWLLLQPRDYLNSFLLYALVIAGCFGMLFSSPSIDMPAFISFNDPDLGFIFPILFVTVACGAISGFHSVVASGTTAKQLDNEKDAKLIGYGGMLVESFVAILALMTAMILSKGSYSEALRSSGPVAIFANGIGGVLQIFHVPIERGTSFAALAVSAFILTTLDTATRLARFAFQEFFEGKSFLSNRFIATSITIAVAGYLAFTGQWKAIWPVFGAANQLLAALALLAVSAWMAKRGLKNGFLKIPMVIMAIITVCALGVLIYKNFMDNNIALLSAGILLMILAVVLLWKARKALRYQS